MKELDEYRKSIDLIDAQLAVLFESRMEQVEKIGKFKAGVNLPILDLEREKEIKEINSRLVKNDVFRTYFEQFYENLISISKQYQKSIYEKQYR